MEDSRQIGFLDLLAIISFAIQMQNQSNIIRISDVQSEVNKAVNDVHQHLQIQDDKLDAILALLRKE